MAPQTSKTLLRKCRVLASRLQNDELKQWVQSELDGYRDEMEVPEYRHIHCHAYGHFFGPYGHELTDLQIPASCDA
jgi:AbiTii